MKSTSRERNDIGLTPSVGCIFNATATAHRGKKNRTRGEREASWRELCGGTGSGGYDTNGGEMTINREEWEAGGPAAHEHVGCP